MLQSLRKDAIISFLVERCSLTEAQLDTILLSQVEGDLKDRAKLRDKKRVSPGAFVRTLRQGQVNVEACIYTMLLLSYLGLIEAGDLQKLARSVELLSKIRESSLSVEALTRLTGAMEDLAQGFSRREKQRFIV
jgi:hypothetical protein